jgi:hypothetical protein
VVQVDDALTTWTTAKTGVIRELGYSGDVDTLFDPLTAHLAAAADVLSALPIDSVLKGFRSQSGLPAPGEGLSGWAAITAESTFGQWVSGLARLSRVLDEPSLAAHAVALVDGYSATLPKSGETGMTIYGWEKLICGLVDTVVYAGYEPASELLSKLVRGASFDQTRPLPVPHDPAGAGTQHTREWYTLPENLYRGFEATGDELLVDFARLWHYDAYWDRFFQPTGPTASWDIPPWLHAYSHVNTFASAGAALDFSGDQRYLRILENAHRWLVETQCYASGGYGPAELTVPADGSLGNALEWRTDTAEIICGTWAAFKLSSLLLRHTGDVHYLDWPERLLYNGLLAALPLHHDGRSPYYADYRLGTAAKTLYWDAWPCCSGTYAQAFSFVPNLVYQSVDEDGIAISLYVPSTLRTRVGGQALALEQQTRFPEETASMIHILEGPLQEVTLWARIPSWAAHVDVRLNHSTSVFAQAGTWLAIRRRWHAGDTLTIDLHPRLAPSPVDRFHPNRVALHYGPVLLAQDAVASTPLSAPVPLGMLDWQSLLARDGDQLLFRPLAPGSPPLPAGNLRPLYDFPEAHPYRVYFDLDTPRVI